MSNTTPNRSAGGSLNAERDAVFDNLNQDIVRVECSTFAQHYLHLQLTDEELRKCILWLQNAKILSDKLRWLCFPSIIGRGSGENTLYRKLERISSAVCEWYKESHKGALENTFFECRPFNSTSSEIQGSSFQSDAHFCLKASDQTRLSSNIVANCEFKLLPQDMVENRKKLAGGVAHYMNNDPCRRYFYSMSVEEYDTRLWYFSRSHCVKTASFHLRKDPEPLIRFIVAMSFGTLRQLGFDETVTRKFMPGQHLYYIYKVGEQFYKTIKLIFEYFPASVCGRATRVWLVEKCDEQVVSEEKQQGVSQGRKQYVLKDYWVDAESKEWEIQHEIFSRLRERRGELIAEGTLVDPKVPSEGVFEFFDALRNFEEYFVTIGPSEVLETSLPIHSSHDRCRAVEDVQEKSAAPEKISKSARSVHSGSVKASSSPENSRNRFNYHPRNFMVKDHCRLVYNDFCPTVAELKSFEEAALAMKDCVTALQLLYLAGYVHHDISAGNVYYGQSQDHSGKKGKLSDFEYARPFLRKDQVAVDPKGTLAFMACEVRANNHLFWRDKKEVPRYLSLELSDIYASLESKRPPLHYHYLHDVELTFWLGLYLFTTRTAQASPSAEDTAKHGGTVASLFADQERREELLLDMNLPHSLFNLTVDSATTQKEIFDLFNYFIGGLHLAFEFVSNKVNIDQEENYRDIFMLQDIFMKLSKLDYQASPMTPLFKPMKTTSQATDSDIDTISDSELPNSSSFEGSFDPSYRDVPDKADESEGGKAVTAVHLYCTRSKGVPIHDSIRSNCSTKGTFRAVGVPNSVLKHRLSITQDVDEPSAKKSRRKNKNKRGGRQ